MSLPSGPILPQSDILNNMACGKFVLSNLAARRAKQLKEGAPPLVRIESNHPLTIALAEIAAGKIQPILGLPEAEHFTGESRLPTLSDDPITGELGILLPALDESEAELMSVLGEDDAELHDEDEEALPVASLEDLLDETEVEPEVIAPESDEETLSLTDIAEQENLVEEEAVSDV